MAAATLEANAVRGRSNTIVVKADNMTKATANQPSGIINQTFPHKVCINLDRRPNRWQEMQRKFEQHGIHSVQRFSALDGDDLKIPANWMHTPGAYGCLLSHLQVVREARQRGLPSVLIFEDDVVFDDQLETKLEACIEELPSDWDMLFFGALHKDEPTKVSENIARITQANSTYACALRSTVFDAFIELNSQTEEVLDNNSLLLQQKFKCYCFMPHLAWVETDYSDAQQRLVDHWYLRESLVVFGPMIDRLLSETTVVFAYHKSVGRFAAENLRFLVQYYQRFFFPLIAIVIVEQGTEPTVDSAILSGNSKYVFWQDDRAFNKERCFKIGLSHADPKHEFFILTDSDIHLETLDIRANLRMCERYDCVIGFSKIIELTNEDSIRLRNTSTTRGIDITKNYSPNNGRPGCCRFLNRDAIETAGGWPEKVNPEAGPVPWLELQQRLRVFQSPNHALRLQQG